MVKGGSTQNLVKSFLAILRMDIETATFFASMSTDQGLFNLSVFFYLYHFCGL